MNLNYVGFSALLVVLLALSIPPVGLVLGVILSFVYVYWWYTRNIATPNYDNLTEEDKLIAFKVMKQSYLKSTQWKNKRKFVLLRDDYTCRHCGSPNNLHIHHISGYNLIPNEPHTCLITLCQDCHQKQHDQYGYPQTHQEYMTWNHPI